MKISVDEDVLPNRSRTSPDGSRSNPEPRRETHRALDTVGRVRAVLLLAIWMVAGLLSPVEGSPNRTEVENLIEGLVELVHESYVLPERVGAIETRLREGLRNGRYHTATDTRVLSNRIMADLRESSGDLHFGIRPTPRGAFPLHPDTTAEPSRNHAPPPPSRPVSGIGRVETLADGVGYIEVLAFPDPALGSAAVDDAFARLADSTAMILDLRHSQGGHPAMVAYLLSHFFTGEPFLFNRLEWPSSGRVIEFDTVADLPSPRFTDRPVFILVSRHTPSAAEGFSYHMKHLGRALIVGQRTAGAAHLTGMFELPGYQIAIPSGRPVSPITGGNWEGTGVEPDHEVPADEALDRALELAAKRR